MPITHVCLSDTHFGDDSSLLSNVDPGQLNVNPLIASPTMVKLVGCIREVIEKTGGGRPTLVLNGDILELALSKTNTAAMVFERFIELTMLGDERMFEDIIFLPGNHDHHLWELARETQYAEFIKKFPVGSTLEAPWHTTKIIDGTVPSYFLNRIVRRFGDDLAGLSIQVSYPSYGIKKNNDYVIFNHGHYIEKLYHLMSKLEDILNEGVPTQRSMYAIEATNFAWIDFFWSTMCRSTGMDFENIYESLPDKEARGVLVDRISKGLAVEFDTDIPGTFVEEKVIKAILSRMVDRVAGGERSKKEYELNPGSEKGLRELISGPLKKQLLEENGNTMPNKMSFVFGHTHKPFERDMNFKEYGNAWVDLYNTGGWVVERTYPQERHGGSVVFVDDNLETAAIRMYNEVPRGEVSPVRAMDASHAGQANNALYGLLDSIIKGNPAPWDDFADTVSREANIRRENMSAKLAGVGGK